MPGAGALFAMLLRSRKGVSAQVQIPIALIESAIDLFGGTDHGMSLRETLKHSHVSAIAIAALLFWVVGNIWAALWTPLPRLLEVLATAIAIRGVPYSAFTGREMLDLQTMLLELVAAAAMYLGASWISRWIYGMAPIPVLKLERKALLRPHA